MFPNTTLPLGANGLIFWSGDDTETHHERSHTGEAECGLATDTESADIDAGDVRDTLEPGQRETFKRPSAYVDLFESSSFYSVARTL
jgi:hypothetical protein